MYSKHDLAYRLVKVLSEKDALRQGTPASCGEDHSTKQSAKIPDPDCLGDGVEPTYDAWKTAIRGKLEVNSGHYTRRHNE